MGRPAVLDPHLIKKLSKKLDKPELKVVKSVSAYAQRKMITSRAALVIYASKQGLGTSGVRKNLTSEELSQVHNLSGEPKKVVGKSSLKKNFAKPSLAEHQDPFLEKSVYNTVNSISAEAYAWFYILENSIRAFISRILKEKYGEGWWQKVEQTKKTAGIAEKVADRKKNESQNWHHSKRGVHEIYYTDYPHLLQIVRSFESDFGSFFKKGPEKNLLGRLEDLSPTRNVVAHNNPITKDDLDRLKPNAKDWIKYMKYLYSQS